MHRYTAVVLVLAFAQLACSNVVKLTKDDAENNVVLPIEIPDRNVQTNAVFGVTENAACAKIGEFCMNDSDCCSNSCLGFLKKCVSGRELDMDQQ